MKDFGTLMACAEMGVAPQSFNLMAGQAEALSGEKAAAVHRLLIKAAHDVMLATGRGHTAPAFHLGFIAKSADWNPHYEEIADHICHVLAVLEPMEKQAFNVGDALAGAGTLGRMGLYGSVGAGGALGTLYWLLSRHANQDDADIEAMDNQVKYYHQLSRELEDSMRRKYRYEGSELPNATQ